MSPRGRKPTAAGAELASAVLTDLAAVPAPTRAEIARRHRISRARVQAIARAAGVAPGGRGGGGDQAGHREASAIVARVRELAAAAGEEPGDWLGDAAHAIRACEAIRARFDWATRHGLYARGTNPFLDELLALAVGRNPELAAQVRAVVDAGGES